MAHPANQAVVAAALPVFRCPSDGGPRDAFVVRVRDGGVRFVSASIDHDTWAAISSVDGGEAVRGDAL